MHLKRGATPDLKGDRERVPCHTSVVTSHTI